jgi:hypothetical protein
MATSIFTAVWNFSSTSYFRYQSAYSILDPTLAWVLGPAPNATNPDGSANTFVQPIIYIKLYADVVVYFTAVAAVAAVGLAGTYVPFVRRVLHRRLGLPPPLLKALAALGVFPHGVSAGELLLLAAVLALYVFWVWYWGFQYARIPQEIASMNDEHPVTHATARLAGHLTTLTLSLALLPVTRNSVWEAVFGVPFDRAVRFHVALGALAWALATYHMALWAGKWAAEGTLGRNFLALGVEIAPCELTGAPCFVNGTDPRQYAWASFNGLFDHNTVVNVTCGCTFFAADTGVASFSGSYHGDNWTVAVVTAAWAMLTGALAIALLARRAHYELFLATHAAALFFVAAAVAHAWSGWYYLAAPLLLLAFDKVAFLAPPKFKLLLAVFAKQPLV